MSTLGPTVMLDPRFEAPTLWGSTAFIGEEVSRLVTDVDQSRKGIASVKEKVNTVLDKMAKVENDKPKEESKLLGILTSVMRRVQGIGPELEEVRANISKLGEEVGRLTKKQKTSPGRNTPGGPDVMDDLMNMLSTDPMMETDDSPGTRVTLEKGGTRGGNGSEGSNHPPGSSIMEEELRRAILEIQNLVRDVGVLKASTEDKSIKFGGLGLRDLSECSEWVNSNFDTHRYGLVMDPLLMLDRIFGSDDHDGDNQFKVLESRVKLKIKTGAEAAAIKALHFNRPRLFHKGRVAMTSERNTSKMSKLPNYKSWKSGGEGVMNYVIKQMNLIYSTVSHDIEYAFGFDPKLRDAKAVATASLNATVTFLTQLMGFIDAIYQKLHSDSKFSGEQAWSLTTQILDRVCEDLYAPKEGVAEAMTVEDPASICSHLLWATFRTHDVMKVYLDHHFENHPAISAEYVKFLATNSGFDKVEKMEVAMTSMKEKVEKAMDVAEKAGKRADAVTDKFSALNKEVEVLKKKVQVLDNKAGK